jgi:hypothetical protein
MGGGGGGGLLGTPEASPKADEPVQWISPIIVSFIAIVIS